MTDTEAMLLSIALMASGLGLFQEGSTPQEPDEPEALSEDTPSLVPS